MERTEYTITNADLHRLYDEALRRNIPAIATIAVRATNPEQRVSRQVCAGIFETWRLGRS
jgi:hypothetical protein